MGSGFPTNLVSICFTFCISDEGVFVLSDVTSGYHVMRGAGLRHLIDCVEEFCVHFSFITVLYNITTWNCMFSTNNSWRGFCKDIHRWQINNEVPFNETASELSIILALMTCVVNFISLLQ